MHIAQSARFSRRGLASRGSDERRCRLPTAGYRRSCEYRFSFHRIRMSPLLPTSVVVPSTRCCRSCRRVLPFLLLDFAIPFTRSHRSFHRVSSFFSQGVAVFSIGFRRSFYRVSPFLPVIVALPDTAVSTNECHRFSLPLSPFPQPDSPFLRSGVAVPIAGVAVLSEWSGAPDWDRSRYARSAIHRRRYLQTIATTGWPHVAALRISCDGTESESDGERRKGSDVPRRPPGYDATAPLLSNLICIPRVPGERNNDQMRLFAPVKSAYVLYPSLRPLPLFTMHELR